MNAIWIHLLGTVRAELCAAEPELLLERCRERGLRLWRIVPRDGCTLRLQLWERDLPALRAMAEDCGGELRVLWLRGGSRDRRTLRRRKALLLALLLAAGLLLASSLFVWELRVQGCERLSQGQVLRALADCGVEPGCFRYGLDTEMLRSRMLEALPELEWMTVNVSGSRATVLVRERREKPEILSEEGSVELRATRPGIVQSVTALRGRALVKPGDAVNRGDVLISGERESLLGPLPAQAAMGEVRAETWHELISVCPLEMLERKEPGRSHGGFFLQVGKKRLGWGAFGGKGLDECDKIMHEYTLGAEGLFSLPLRLIRVERRGLLPGGGALSREREMQEALLRRLETEIDGEVLEHSFSVGRSRGLLIVTLRARCSENIAGTVEDAPTGQ